MICLDSDVGDAVVIEVKEHEEEDKEGEGHQVHWKEQNIKSNQVFPYT